MEETETVDVVRERSHKKNKNIFKIKAKTY